MDEIKTVFVTCVGDYFNSADSSGFFVIKGQVKPLPEITTPIIEDALEQKLLREATREEVEKYEQEREVENAIQKGIIKVGKTYVETVDNYAKYVMKKQHKEETIIEPTKSSKPIIEEKPKISEQFKTDFPN